MQRSFPRSSSPMLQFASPSLPCLRRRLSNSQATPSQSHPRSAIDHCPPICSSSAAAHVDVGFRHCIAIKTGLSGYASIANSIFYKYCKSGFLDHARKMFDEMCNPDIVMWTTLIAGYSRKNDWCTGLVIFSEMIRCNSGAVPNCFTLSSAFRCCTGLRDLSLGRGIHGWVLRKGIGLDTVLENSMVDFYAKCGSIQNAKYVFERILEPDMESWNVMMSALMRKGDVDGSMEVFRRLPTRDVVSWNTIISGQMQGGFDRIALRLLYEMAAVGPEFNHFTLSMALALAGDLVLLQLGRQVHSKILRSVFVRNVHLNNSLIDMYCKCGETYSALIVFNSMPWFRDRRHSSFTFNKGSMEETVSWCSMISGYVHNGMDEEALSLFRRMIRENVEIDLFTLTSICSACAYCGILEQGRQVHACTEKSGHGFDVVLSSAISYMYAKCGSLEDAQAIFDKAEVRNFVLWTSIIGSYAFYGKGMKAIQLFELMLKENIKPNDVTFVNILSACCHAGLVEEGYKYFKSMQEDHGVDPKPEHFTCMVDLLGRAGLLIEAKDFIVKHKISDLGTVLRALLSACRIRNDIPMANWVSEKLVELEPFDANSYILLSNTYSQKMLWSNALIARNMMREKGATNRPGQSWIQLKGKIHTFFSGDRSHPNLKDISAYLEKLMWRIEELGYRKDINLSLHDVEEEEREALLNVHSEKLAVAYGIMSTPNGAPIRVMKNLRVCGDCHTAIKYISQVTCREIVLRDALRFHQFKNGHCSCGDFW